MITIRLLYRRINKERETMKIRKRILALILAAVTAFSLWQPAVAAASAPAAIEEAPQMTSVEEYKAFVQQARGHSYGTQFYGFLRTVRFMIRMLFGQLLLPDSNFKVSIDPLIDGYCAYIAENSDLDVTRILTNLPDTSKPAELIVRTFRIDTDEMRAAMYKKRDELWDQGKYGMAYVYYFLGAYFSVMESCDVTAVQTDEENVYEVVLLMHYRNGSTEELHPGIFINDETGLAYNRDGSGIVGTGFNCSMNELLVYATVNGWMRQYGFCIWYDLACYISPNWMWQYKTRRFKFTYDDREWMIQIWKGSYLFTNGGEVGVYNRDKKKVGSYYDSAGDEDMLVMSMTVLHGEDEILSLPAARHWWINGFKMAKTVYPPSSLTLHASIEMKDEQMRDAFCKAIDRNIHHDVTYTTEDLTVYLDW